MEPGRCHWDAGDLAAQTPAVPGQIDRAPEPAAWGTVLETARLSSAVELRCPSAFMAGSCKQGSDAGSSNSQVQLFPRLQKEGSPSVSLFRAHSVLHGRDAHILSVSHKGLMSLRSYLQMRLVSKGDVK